MKPQGPILRLAAAGAAAALLAAAVPARAQQPGTPPAGDEPSSPDDRPPFGGLPPGGPGGFMPFGPGGPGGMMGQERELVAQFDRDGDERLNAQERKTAREFLQKERSENPGRRGPGGGRGGPPGFGGFGARGEDSTPAQPGAQLSQADVRTFPGKDFYDPTTLRTLFLEFADSDWEQELADFNNTDVEVPANLTVDGKTYRDVGVHFRGNTSYMMVPEGRKRPLNLSLDYVHGDQDVGGYRTLNLLNAHEDPTFMHTVLALDIAREYFPAPKANFVRVVINGESWGVYVSAQQFNKDFIKEWWDTKKGARWKVTGRPGGQGGMTYLGDDPEAYQNIYTIKSKDDPESWAALITLCRTLDTTPADQLEQALAPLLDLDGTLRFLAWDNALANGDGFWARASDYNLYRDPDGRFHLIPHDANETFSLGGGPGGRGGPGGPGGFGPGMATAPESGGPRGGFAGPGGREGRVGAQGPGGRPGRDGARGPGGFGGGGGVELDPLVAANDPGKPLLSKLLAVPSLRSRYLGYVRDMAEQWLDWNTLGPRVQAYRRLIEADVKADTKKLDSFEAFERGVADDLTASGAGEGVRGGSLQSFADQRRAYLLKATEP